MLRLGIGTECLVQLFRDAQRNAFGRLYSFHEGREILL
jgi:hypothetical protein